MSTDKLIADQGITDTIDWGNFVTDCANVPVIPIYSKQWLTDSLPDIYNMHFWTENIASGLERTL